MVRALILFQMVKSVVDKVFPFEHGPLIVTTGPDRLQMSSPHKPRRRNKKVPPGSSSNLQQSTPAAAPKGHAQEPQFPLAAFLWSARNGTSQWVILPLILMIAGLFRWALGFWGYSGRWLTTHATRDVLTLTRFSVTPNARRP